MSGDTYIYQRTRQFFGQLTSGSEDCGANELESFGATKIKTGFRGVYFCAEREVLYRIVYETRIFSRILAPLIAFDCHSEKYLYRTAQQIDWSELMTLTKTFAIGAHVSDSHIRNSQYAGQIMKDAIVDQFRDRTGKRPDVNTQRPDLLLNLHIRSNKARISIDLGGGSLHRRGYRQLSVEAPMQETLAATMVRLSEWKETQALYDPFCGSGTLLLEAFMLGCHIPASYLRKQSGMRSLPDFDATLWNQVLTRARAAIQPPTNLNIQGSDSDPEALKAVRANRAELPEGNAIRVRRSDFRDLEGFEDTLIITNPPFGIRLGNADQTAELLREFGDFLKQRCRGCTAFIYYGDTTMVKKLGLKPEWKHPLNNGGLEGVFCKYTLY